MKIRQKKIKKIVDLFVECVEIWKEIYWNIFQWILKREEGKKYGSKVKKKKNEMDRYFYVNQYMQKNWKRLFFINVLGKKYINADPQFKSPN